MSEIESIRPTLTVILDDGDWVINSTGPIGKAMAQAILPAAASAKRVTVISDGEMKVMKRNGAAENQAAPVPVKRVPAPPPAAPDVQDEFVADLESGVTGEIATGEQLAPAVKPAPAKRKPQIFQDAAAPPAPELAQAEMERLLAEAAQAEQDAARVAEDQRFQRQQAVQAGEDPAATAETEAAAQPRRRRERTLATSGRPCGRCGGGGQIVGESGFQGACPVCHGEGQVKTWDRALKVR